MITTNHTTLRMSGALNIEHLTSLKLHVGVNAHGWAIVEGEAGENALEQLSGALAGREQHILTLDESGAEKCLFAGVIREAEMVRVGNYNRFHVELLSGTCLMDREVRSRSFQDVGRTYSQVAQQVCSEYSGGAAICTVGEDKPLGQPVIQYRETDWEFLMRMAGHCSGVLVPETHRGLPRLWFGFPDRSFTCEFPEDAYTSGISQRYYELGGSAAGYSKADFFYYDVESPQLCDLGWYTVFKGQPFIISEKYAILERGELIFTYRLGHPGLGWGKMLYNEKISGMTLLGEVLETSRETLKLKLDIDAGWNPGGPYPYTWRPETGNFMYCMPQVGTRVSLYCPNYDEKTAIAVNCVRTNGGDCDRMSDPSKRSFVTEHGKEMNLYPGEMSLLGGSNGQVQVLDEEGIIIGSEKPVVIRANLGAHFKARNIGFVSPKQELVMAKVRMADRYVKSSYLQSSLYSAKANFFSTVEGWVHTAYAKIEDVIQEVKQNAFPFFAQVVGGLVAIAVVGALAISGVGVLSLFVIGGAVAGAVTTGLLAAKDAFDRGESFFGVVGAAIKGALTGGFRGGVAGLVSYGIFSLGSSVLGVSIAQMSLLNVLELSGYSGFFNSLLFQMCDTGSVNLRQAVNDGIRAVGWTYLFAGLTRPPQPLDYPPLEVYGVPELPSGTPALPPAGGVPALSSTGGVLSLPPAGGVPVLPPIGGTIALPPAGGTLVVPPTGGALALPLVGGIPPLPIGGILSLPGAVSPALQGPTTGIVGPIEVPPPKAPPEIETIDPVEQFYLELFEQQEATYPEYEQFLEDMQAVHPRESGAKGLIGHAFEDYLHRVIGGESQYIKGSTAGRDFDGVCGSRWYEAKSGGYWDLLLKDKSVELKFKQKMAEGLKIAKEYGATYELFSNVPIPDAIKAWLTKKGIPFTEILD